MATFTDNIKSSQGTFTDKSKNTDTWSNVQHSDIIAAGFDVQTFDNPNNGFDTVGNTLITSWTKITKENG